MVKDMAFKLAKASFIALAVVAALFAGNLATQAQGFSVQPMRVDAGVPPARSARIPIEIANTSDRDAQVLELEIVDMLQQPNGQWQFLREGSDELQGAPLSSSEWISLDDNAIELDAGETETVPLMARLPANARGTYIAGLLVRSRPAGDSDAAVRIRLQFLVPVILSVEGRPARQQIAIPDLTMEFFRPVGFGGAPRGEPTTIAYIHADNEGQTYSRLNGYLQVDRQQGGSWRRVTRLDVEDRGIIPGASLKLPFDMERVLPPGTYRLTSQIEVDGRRLPRVVREISYAGDPDAEPGDTVDTAFDATLILEPPLVEMDIVPGATRTATLSITNPNDQRLNVNIAAATPEALAGKVMGDLLGETLAATPWIRISPSQFTIRPEGQRNVRVVSRIPREGVDNANYYADIIIDSTYSDGQNAGTIRSALRLNNEEIVEQRGGVVERLALVNAGAAQNYVVQSRFVNTGNVHVEPSMTADLLAPNGEVVASLDLEGEAGRLLPLGIRDYSGELDFSEIADGEYLLRASTSLGADGDADVERRVNLRVGPDQDNPGSGRTVEIIN